MKIEEIIEELVAVILMQEKELDKLREQINRVNQYVEVYEELIERSGSKWQR